MSHSAYLIVSTLDKGIIKLKVSLTVICSPVFYMHIYSRIGVRTLSSGSMQINTNTICNATSASAHLLGIR